MLSRVCLGILLCVVCATKALADRSWSGGGNLLTHATDCTGGGVLGELYQQCVDLDDGKMWTCADPAAGGNTTRCDSGPEWLLNSASASAGVSTFEGRAGAVVSGVGDYAAAEITNTPAGGIAATDVQGAIDELDTEKSSAAATQAVADDLADHIADTSDAHDASAISNVAAGTIAATDVQAAINEIDGDVSTHTAATTAHGATATPTASRIPLAGGAGTIDGGWLPAPQASVFGGVLASGNCNATTGKMIGVDTSGLPVCGTDQNTGGGITDLTGDVTGTGPGSTAATIANDAVSNAKLANMANATIKCRTTAGTGDPEDCTASQVATILDAQITTQTEGDAKVTGPGSATDNAVTRFDSTTGKLVQNSGVTIDDSNNISTAGAMTAASYTSSGTAEGELTFNEASANGSNFVRLRGNASRAGDLTYVLPSTDPTSGQFLQAGAPSAGVVATSWATPSGSGDASTNTSSSVDNEITLFSGTGGKTLKRATTTGVIKGTSGVIGAATADDLAAPAYCADAGSTDDYACSLSPAITAYTTGSHYIFKANTANTGAATVNFNSLGAKTIKKVQSAITTDLSDNDIRVGQFIELVYDGTNMQMVSQLGNAPAGGSGAMMFHGHCASASQTNDVLGLSSPSSSCSTGQAWTNFNQQLIPKSGTLKNLYCYTATAVTAGNSVTYTVHVDSAGAATPAASSLTCTMAEATQSCNNTGTSVSVTAGQILMFRNAKTANTALGTGFQQCRAIVE